MITLNLHDNIKCVIVQINSYRWIKSMDNMLQALKQYFHETLGLQPVPKPWKGKENLPFFLQDLYDFYTVTLLGKMCILAVARESEAITPAEVRKQLGQIQEKTGIPCIYVDDSVSSYNRKRLVVNRVQFVIPEHQMYLPALGIDWLENCRMWQKHDRDAKAAMSPSAQAVMIYALIQEGENQFIPLELAKALSYSPMSMTRALNELESLNLGKTTRKGKERQFSFIKDRPLLWAKVQSLMQNPTKRRLWLKLKKNSLNEIKQLGVFAGISALADLSMLAQPKIPIYAISARSWKALQQLKNIQELPTDEEADIQLEIWSYDPRLFAKKGIIDLFSLYLSLREEQDERVEAALKKLFRV